MATVTTNRPGVRRILTGYQPHHYQLEIHRGMGTHRFGVVVTHRRFGKTVCGVNQLINDAAYSRKQSPEFAYCAPYLKQAKKTAWKYLKRFAMTIPGTTKNEGELFVQFPNEAKISLFGADNAEAMRGMYFDGIHCDEIANFDPDIWPEIIRPALSDREGWAMFTGTPRGEDAFHDLWVRCEKNEPGWYGAMYRADETDLPWLPESELALARSVMSDQAYRREYLCDFSASTDDVLITIDLVSEAAKKTVPLQTNYDGIAKVMGIDVARFGDDKTVIAKRQGPLLDPLVRLEKRDNMTVASIVAATADHWKPDAIFIDGGRGEGVIDRLRSLGYEVIEVNFGGTASDNAHYANKRSEIWDLTRDWLEEGGMIPNDTHLKSDLCTPMYSFNSNGKMLLEPKDKIKERLGRSTDDGDAVALTFALPVRPKQINHTAKIPGSSKSREPISYKLPWERQRRK